MPMSTRDQALLWVRVWTLFETIAFISQFWEQFIQLKIRSITIAVRLQKFCIRQFVQIQMKIKIYAVIMIGCLPFMSPQHPSHFTTHSNESTIGTCDSPATPRSRQVNTATKQHRSITSPEKTKKRTPVKGRRKF